ncbi:MAG: hypothetical protein J6Q17_05700 [Clostridia bacterium]|nr:hypothetical protein [Clostridia bacterium]
MKKRILTILTAAILLFSSCANGTDSGQDPAENSTTPASPELVSEMAAETEPEITDDLPERDFDGADVVIWADTAEFDVFYDADLDGEVVNDAIFNRNTTVSERFNVHLQYDLDASMWRSQQDLISTISAGTQAYDLVSGVCCYLSTTGLAGCLRNLNNREYLDFEKPWYMQFVNDNIILGDKLIFTAGFFDMPSMARTLVTFYSTDLAEQYGVSNLYDTVREGKWTYDYMMGVSESVLTDIDGNGIYDENDRYGITSQWDCIGFLYPSSGYSYVTFNDDGTVVTTTPTEEVYAANELLYNLLYNCDYYYSGYDKGGPHNYDNMRTVFTSNRALFFINSLFYAQHDEMREMGTYGILTPPKYREDQERYGSVSSVFVTGIPMDAPDPERSAILLEALEYESWKQVRPAYYDIALSQKYVNDPESAAMLDIVFENVHCDFSYVYSGALNGTVFALSVGLCENYASWYQTQVKAMNKSLNKMMEKAAKMKG